MATQTLSNGYCGLPIQKSCPHANACLTCPVFLSGPEFLPELREQRHRTLTLIQAATGNGPDPDRGDEQAGPHQPGQDDRRNRKRQRTGGRQCRLTTPATSSRPRDDGPSRHASAPSPPCGAWMPPASASPSTPSAAPRLASPGPGFTPSRTCAPRSSGSASDTRPLRRRRFLHSGSAPRIPRCYAASRRPPPASASWKQTTSNSATPWPGRSANAGPIEVLGQVNGRDTPKKNSPKIIGPC